MIEENVKEGDEKGKTGEELLRVVEKWTERRGNTDGRIAKRERWRWKGWWGRTQPRAATTQQARWMTSYLWTLGFNETSRGQTMASLTHTHLHTHTVMHIHQSRRHMYCRCTHTHTHTHLQTNNTRDGHLLHSWSNTHWEYKASVWSHTHSIHIHDITKTLKETK